MTRVVRFHEIGGPEVLKIEDVALPTPKAGEMRVRVEAIGLNRAESMFRSGMYLEQPVFPSSNGYEASAIVAELGPGVTGFNIGDAVSVIPAFPLTKYGVYGDEAIVPVHAVFKRPAGLVRDRIRRRVDGLSHGLRRPRRYRARCEGRCRHHHGRLFERRHCRHPDGQLPRRRLDRGDAHARQGGGAQGAGRPARRRDGRGGSGRRSDAHHERQGRARGVRSGGGSGDRQARGGHGAAAASSSNTGR